MHPLKSLNSEIVSKVDGTEGVIIVKMKTKLCLSWPNGNQGQERRMVEEEWMADEKRWQQLRESEWQ